MMKKIDPTSSALERALSTQRAAASQMNDTLQAPFRCPTTEEDERAADILDGVFLDVTEIDWEESDDDVFRRHFDSILGALRFLASDDSQYVLTGAEMAIDDIRRLVFEVMARRSLRVGSAVPLR